MSVLCQLNFFRVAKIAKRSEVKEVCLVCGFCRVNGSPSLDLSFSIGQWVRLGLSEQ